MFQKGKKNLANEIRKTIPQTMFILILIVDKCGHRGLRCDPNFYLL